MKCGKWYDMVHPVQKRMVHPVQKITFIFLIYCYVIYNIADAKNRWPEDRPRLLLSGRASSQGAAFFIDRKGGEIRNIRGKQQMNKAQRAKVMQIIDKHGRS